MGKVPVWRFEFFGGLRARNGRAEVAQFRTHKTAALLALLAYHPGREYSRDVLVDRLWGDDEEDSARHKLSVALSSLRSQLEPSGVPDGSVLVAGRLSISLNPEAVSTDVAEFREALKAAEGLSAGPERAALLARAVELYQGELLPGHYEEWVFPEQQQLLEQALRAMGELVRWSESTGDLRGALRYALRAVAADPLREESHREAIRLYLALEDRGGALRQYRELGRVLGEQLGLRPSAGTMNLVRGIEGFTELPPPEARGRRGRGGRSPVSSAIPPAELEPVGGAAPVGSAFYVDRETDRELQSALRRRDSIVLVKGPRQVGKTSLLARGLQTAREAGARVALSDFDALNEAQLASPDDLLRALALMLTEQLDLDAAPLADWEEHRGPNLNFRRFLRREVLREGEPPLVWGLDEVDRLFTVPFGTEIFGLFRSWHNERAIEPAGPWSRLTLAIAYATEAHLFIADLNRSPFNVGTRLALEDFTPEQVADLNGRHGGPLKSAREVEAFYGLVGGHPYLVRRGLYELARGVRWTEFEARLRQDDWIYGDHLRRMLGALRRDPALTETVREILAGRGCEDGDHFYRLRSAGVIVGGSPQDFRVRCRLYDAYLRRSL